VVATELEGPLTVRRRVAFSEAVHAGEHTVEGVTGRLSEPEKIDAILDSGGVPVLVDPGADVLSLRPFDVVVDARMAKRNLGTSLGDAPIVIGIGPGFTAGVDCHAVVETLQGGGMGSVILEGGAKPNTGEPCALNLPGGIPTGKPAERRVLRAPGDGILKARKAIEDFVEPGDVVAEVDGVPVVSDLAGVLRGLVKEGLHVNRGLKIGEVDLSGKRERCRKVSEKANAVAGGVLEACYLLGRRVWG
jgi:xanthine dehydrogenase accessory factor